MAAGCREVTTRHSMTQNNMGLTRTASGGAPLASGNCPDSLAPAAARKMPWHMWRSTSPRVNYVAPTLDHQPASNPSKLCRHNRSIGGPDHLHLLLCSVVQAGLRHLGRYGGHCKPGEASASCALASLYRYMHIAAALRSSTTESTPGQVPR